MCTASATKMGIICHGNNSKLMQQQVCPGHISQVRLCGRNEDEPSLKQLAGQRKGDSKYPTRSTQSTTKLQWGNCASQLGANALPENLRQYLHIIHSRRPRTALPSSPLIPEFPSIKGLQLQQQYFQGLG